MSDVLMLVAVLGAGMVLGVVYFGGLWATIQRLASARRPAVLAFTSFVLRTVVVVAGLTVLYSGDVRRLGIGVLGLLVVRTVAVRQARVSLTAAGGQ